MAGTTPMTLLKDTYVWTWSSICPFRLTKSYFISLAPSVRNVFMFIFENIVSVNSLHSDGT